jgi:hypothetical protein
VSALVGVTIGVKPGPSLDPTGAVQRVNEGGGSATLSHRRARIQRGLIAFETAAALVLLVGAGLLVNSFGRLMSEDAGMRERDLWVVRGTLPMRYRAPADTEFWLSALPHLRDLPDVESAALVVNDSGPLDGRDISRAKSFLKARPEDKPRIQPQSPRCRRRYHHGHSDCCRRRFPTRYRPQRRRRRAQPAAAALWPGGDPLKRLGGFGPAVDADRHRAGLRSRLDGRGAGRIHLRAAESGRWRRRPQSCFARPGARAITTARAILLNLRRTRAWMLTMAQVRWKPLASGLRTAVPGLCRHGDVPGSDRHLGGVTIVAQASCEIPIEWRSARPTHASYR